MSFNILFDYPFWIVLVCLVCAIIYSALLYYRNARDGFGTILRWVLAVFRFLAVSIIALLLLAPLIEKLIQQVEEPLIVFIQDNSTSLLQANDSAYYQDNYLPEMNDFMESLSDGYNTRIYTFGENFRDDEHINFSDRVTNMSDIFRELDARYSNRNLGAAIIAGDGIYNRGTNPVYAATNVAYPIYTIALGDTVPQRDLIIKQVNHNRITYLGNRFPVEIVVEAIESRGVTGRLTVSRNGEELFGENVSFTSDHHIQTISLQLEADLPGLQQYRAAISPVEDEVSLDNNERDFFIDVIDGRQQILILANSPHPDIGAIKQSLEDNDQYDVDTGMISDFDGSLEAYDLIIMHQLPSGEGQAGAIFDQVISGQGSLLFIIGSQTNIAAFNEMQNALEIQQRSSELVETLPEYNRAFTLFSMQEQSINLIEALPPLFSPFAAYLPGPGANVLMYQKIGRVVTEQPLMLFAQSGQNRTGIITGEGIWRWRLNNFLRNGNHLAFDEMISRIVQYLALQEDRSRFRVQTDNLVFENESVLFEAELYDASFELVNEPEVQLFITNEEGVEFTYVPGRTANAYRLDAGVFSSGTYNWEARVVLGDESFSDEGVFNVRSLDLEGLQTIADHNVLFRLAENSDAMMFHPGQWDELRDHIMSREDIKPRLYAYKEFVEMINMKLLFFIILLFLSMEWFVRKRSGSY
jgi:hypothetical protein